MTSSCCGKTTIALPHILSSPGRPDIRSIVMFKTNSNERSDRPAPHKTTIKRPSTICTTYPLTGFLNEMLVVEWSNKCLAGIHLTLLDLAYFGPFKTQVAGSAQRVGFFNIGSGRVGYWTKCRVAGRVGVSKNSIGYFRVSLLLSGISGYSGYVGYFWVFLGLPLYTRVIF